MLGTFTSVPHCLSPGLSVTPRSLHPLHRFVHKAQRWAESQRQSTDLPSSQLSASPVAPGAASLLPAQSWSNCPLLWAPGTPPLSAVLQRALSAGRLCVYGNLPETVCTAASSTLAAFEIWELAPCWVEDRAALYLVEVPGKAPD